jgi:hypothetical protein
LDDSDDSHDLFLVNTLARYLWAAPNTLIGLLFVPLVWLTGGQALVTDGVLELHGGVLARLLARMPLVGAVAAITFGHVVIARDRRALELTRSHERVHVRQCERWGPFFLPAYFLASLWAAVNGQGAYRGNYFEQQARLMETE